MSVGEEPLPRDEFIQSALSCTIHARTLDPAFQNPCLDTGIYPPPLNLTSYLIFVQAEQNLKGIQEFLTPSHEKALWESETLAEN